MMRTRNRTWRAAATMASLITSITRPASRRGQGSRADAARSPRSRSKWRTGAVAASALAVMSTTFVAGTLPAAAQPTSFGCSPSGLLFQAADADDPTTINAVDLASGETSQVADMSIQVNAVGHSADDGFVYGVNADNNDIVRIGDNGEHEVVSSVLPDATYFVGDVDENNHYWLEAGNTWYQVDLNTGNIIASGASSGAGIQDHNFFDWTYIPGTNALWTVAYHPDEDRYDLYSFDRTTQTWTQETTGLPVMDMGITGGAFGAMYTAADGNLYAAHNSTGEIYRIDPQTGDTTFFSQAGESSFNDGARCASAPIPVDFGDAPDSYDTLLGSGGPRHSVPGFDPATETAPLTLGSNVSLDEDGQPSGAADLDTHDDGVSNVVVSSTEATNSIDVSMTNDTGGEALLAGWMDLDGNDTFDPGELVQTTVAAGQTTATLDFDGVTTSDDTYMRLRLYGDTTTEPSPVGPASSGEVEDHLVTVTNPDIDLLKEPDTGVLVAGEEITYTFTVSNTGDETLTDVTLSEVTFDGSGDMSAISPSSFATLEVGEPVTATATYTVTQEDVDAGEINNTADVVGTGAESGAEVTDVDDASIPAVHDPDITLTKTADPVEYSTVGETITYDFVAENTGNVTLTDVVISETSFDGAGSMSAIDTTPAQPATLSPGDTLEGTATYTIEQADIDAGAINNTADVVGTPPEGEDVTDTDDAVVTAVQEPALVFDKSASPTTDLEVDDEITYTFTAENTGNTTLTNVEIGETSFSGSGSMSAIEFDQPVPATLAPGDILTGTATYTLTQADIDAGVVTNEACATGDGDISECDDEELPHPEDPDIVLEKTPDPSEYDTVGQTITYTFEATNTGNVTLNDVVISETSFDGAGDMSAITGGTADALAPEETLTGTATYTIEQADIDAGVVNNSALAEGTSPEGTEVDDPADAQITAVQDPSLELLKTADQTDGLEAGDTVTYSFVATNTGNVTVSNVEISESEFSGTGSMSELGCDPAQPATLAPDEVLECTSTYEVTESDAEAGQIHNEASVTGDTPGGGTVEDNDDESVNASAPLPKTGAGVKGMSALGLALLAGGALLLARRRKGEPDVDDE